MCLDTQIHTQAGRIGRNAFAEPHQLSSDGGLVFYRFQKLGNWLPGKQSGCTRCLSTPVWYLK